MVEPLNPWPRPRAENEPDFTYNIGDKVVLSGKHTCLCPRKWGPLKLGNRLVVFPSGTHGKILNYHVDLGRWPHYCVRLEDDGGKVFNINLHDREFYLYSDDLNEQRRLANQCPRQQAAMAR